MFRERAYQQHRNFWSVFKRTISATYICPRPDHLDRYLDEQIFRFNSREGKTVGDLA